MQNHTFEFFFHPGWACGSSFFEVWSSQFEEWGNLQIFDRGYFLQEKESSYYEKVKSIGTGEGDVQRVVMTHSLGLHLVPEQLLQTANWIVILSGFAFFHPRKEKSRRKSQQIIRKMLKRLREYPQDTVEKFYQNCFFPQNSTLVTPLTLDVEQLYHDLEFLNVHVWEAFEGIDHKDVLILHGEEDQIVSTEQAIILHLQIPKSTLTIIPNAGHALPLTHAEECYSEIKNIILKTAV